jgi:hypothetical protein
MYVPLPIKLLLPVIRYRITTGGDVLKEAEGMKASMLLTISASSTWLPQWISEERRANLEH